MNSQQIIEQPSNSEFLNELIKLALSKGFQLDDFTMKLYLDDLISEPEIIEAIIKSRKINFIPPMPTISQLFELSQNIHEQKQIEEKKRYNSSKCLARKCDGSGWVYVKWPKKNDSNSACVCVCSAGIKLQEIASEKKPGFSYMSILQALENGAILDR